MIAKKKQTDNGPSVGYRVQGNAGETIRKNREFVT